MSGRKVQVRRDAQGVHLDDGVSVRFFNRGETVALEEFFAADHSMCARLVPYPRDWIVDWCLEHPIGGRFAGGYSTAAARELGYAIPDNRTVEERVADILRELDKDETPYVAVAARLAELGLLAEEEGDA